jgi:HEPN domain-containing protein
MARYALEDIHPKQLEICCYECQQAVEKALKAYLVYMDDSFPHIHDCRKLCFRCAEYDERFNDYADDCADITPYATRARYPDDEEMDEPEAQSALRKAGRVLAFCSELLAPTGGEYPHND